MRPLFSAGLLLGGLVAAAPSAALGDLTGIWRGTSVCQYSSDLTGFYRERNDFAIRIDDDPNGLAKGEIGSAYQLRVIPDPDSPTKGRVTGVGCAISDAMGGYVIDVAVKAKDASDPGSMRGTFLTIGISPLPASANCKIKLKRAELTLPGPILDCP